MGGMHAWTWAERYPDFVDIVVPLACEPAAMGGRNWMLRRMVIDAIRRDPDWREGNYRQQPTEWRKAQVFFNIATNGGALALYTGAPTGPQADAELDRRLTESTKGDTNDVLYQFEASRDYDPSPGLERISARVLAINSEDDERNPSELGVMEAAMKRLKNGRYALLPITAQSRGHSTTANAALWKSYLDELLNAIVRPDLR
jgi:homoserine O-acetyltransferase